MSITLQWDNSERTVIRFDFDGRWTASQFDQALDHALTLMRGMTHMVHALGVIHRSEWSGDPQQVCENVESWPSNLGGLIFVDAPIPFRAAFNRLDQVRSAMPGTYFVNTLQEAYETITMLHLSHELYDQ